MITSFFKKSPTKRKASSSTASNKRARGRHGARATGGKEPENDEKVAEEVEDDAGADMGDESKVVTVTVGGVDISINETWEKVLRKEFKKPYFQALQKFVAKERKKCVLACSHRVCFTLCWHSLTCAQGDGVPSARASVLCLQLDAAHTSKGGHTGTRSVPWAGSGASTLAPRTPLTLPPLPSSSRLR